MRFRLGECYERAGGVCWICGLPGPLELMSRDHVEPRRDGTRGREVRLAHSRCNTARGDLPAADVVGLADACPMGPGRGRLVRRAMLDLRKARAAEASRPARNMAADLVAT